MAKYKCNECGHIFEGDLATMECPQCGSGNIKKASTFGNKGGIIGIIAVVGVLLLVGISLFFHQDKEITAVYEVKGGNIEFTVKGVKQVTLQKDYQIVIYDSENQTITQLSFYNGKPICDMNILIVGETYTFQLTKSNQPVSAKWLHGNQYTVPEPLSVPVIKHINTGIADYEKKVWNKVTIEMEKKGDFTYQIGNIEQTSNVFNGLKPGDYIVKVTNEDGTSCEQSFILSEIKDLPKSLTKQDIQNILDKVANKSMDVRDALHDLTGGGNVDLATTIEDGNISNLYDLLRQTSFGKLHFQVESFEIDPNTHKIKNKTLKVRKLE